MSQRRSTGTDDINTAETIIMTNVATTLLDYILNLLNDPEAMADYVADRDGALSAAGLSGCGEEVDAALTSAGAGHSLYYAPAKFHYSDWSDDRDVVFVKKYSDDDGIDDSVVINESFNDNITNSFNTNTTINDNDFTNNGVIIDGDGNTVDNTVSDDDTTITNVNSNNTTVGGDVVEGDDNSIVTNGGDGAGSGAIVDASGGDGGDGGDGGTTSSTQSGLVNVGDVGLGVGVGLLGEGTGVADVGDSADGGDGGQGGQGGDVTFS